MLPANRELSQALSMLSFISRHCDKIEVMSSDAWKVDNGKQTLLHPPILLRAYVCTGKTRVAMPKADRIKGDREEKQQKKKKKQKQQVQTRKTSHGNRNPQLENPWQRARCCPCPGPALPGQPQGTTNSFVLHPSRQVKEKSEKRRQWKLKVLRNWTKYL